MKKFIDKISIAIHVYMGLFVSFFSVISCRFNFHTWILKEFKYTDAKDIGFKIAYKHKKCMCEKCGAETKWCDAFWGSYAEDLTLGIYKKDKWYTI